MSPSSFRSSNSIDHLHSKRDSAYSSFSTSSSIPEYLASTPTFSPERSCSLEAVSQRGGSGDMQQADVHYVRALYDNQQRLLQEQELSSASAAPLQNPDPRGRGPASGLTRELPGSARPTSGDACGFRLEDVFLVFSWWSLLPRRRRWPRWRPSFQQTQRGSHLGPGRRLQLLREPEGGTGSAQAQRQLRGPQEPRPAQLLVQSGARQVTAVSRPRPTVAATSTLEP